MVVVHLLIVGLDRIPSHETDTQMKELEKHFHLDPSDFHLDSSDSHLDPSDSHLDSGDLDNQNTLQMIHTVDQIDWVSAERIPDSHHLKDRTGTDSLLSTDHC